MAGRVQPIGIRDALFGVLFAALCFAICRAQIEGSGAWLRWVGPFIPAIITGSLQRRFRISPPNACVILYPITIAWGFVGGVTYSLHWIRTPHEFFERNTLGVEQPLHFGLVAAQIWIFVGLLYVLTYTVLVWLVSTAVAKWPPKRDGQ